MQKEPLCWKSKDEVPEENRVIDIFSNIYDQPMSEYKAELKADHHGDVFATHMTYITHTGRGQSLQHSLVLGIEPRTSCILGEHLTTGLYPQPHSASYLVHGGLELITILPKLQIVLIEDKKLRE